MEPEDHPPPTTYDLGPAFRPTGEWTEIEGLRETVQRLVGSEKYRTALDEIFRVLNEDPLNEETLTLTVVVLSAGRTARLEAAEPLTDRYLRDPRLDPIFAVCSNCGTRSWVPKNYLTAFRRTGVTNPMGLQCYACGFVVCRECLETRTPPASTEPSLVIHSPECPQCAAPELSPIVYPTGRQRWQMKRHKDPVVQAIVFREGPIKPSGAYMKELFETVSPDVLEDRAKLRAVPVLRWEADMEGVVHAYVARLERGEGPTGALEHAEFCETVDEVGNRVYIAKIMAPSQEDDVGDDVIKATLVAHLNRTVEQYAGKPGWDVTQSMVAHLAEGEHVDWAVSTLAALGTRASVEGSLTTQPRRSEDLVLACTAVPGKSTAECREHFGQHGYGGYLQALAETSGFLPGQRSFAHWVYCPDAADGAIHLTVLPASTDGLLILAVDMLTPDERRGMGL